ncbi:biotin holocarboxylase synthetase, partial [Rhizopus stolonifer]
MNILVYNDLGASPNSVRHTVSTLKSILGHAYDVIEIDRRVLQSEPWEVGCVMLVMPGGRDMPYCEALNGEPNGRIQRFVQGGGRYLGICAGAYYASASIEFEKGRALMEIIQERELGLYPGLSRGTAYPGFVYNSESGARSVTVSLCKDTLEEYYGTNVPQEINMYYNGGGYFVDPDYDHVTVLCRYKDLDAAAVVHCRVGMGHALLIGTHPEYDVSSDDLLSIDEHASQSVRKILDDLVLSEVERKRFLRAAFARIGLSVVPLNSNIVQENIMPDPTPIYITGLTKEWVQKPVSYLLKKSNPVTHIMEDKGDIFCILLMEEQTSKQVQLLSMCRVKEEKAPVIQLVYQSTIDAIEPICPPFSMTPHFNMQIYYDHLVKKRALQWEGGGWPKFGNGVMYAEVISSTQSILEKNYEFSEALPSGFVCLASNQIAGRGRGRNSWVSQSGALQFSIVLRHSLQFRNAPVVFVQYIIALAVVESIRSRPGYEHIPLRLKWPNDIYIETKESLKKVGGLLINSSFVDNDFVLVI